LKPFLAKAMIQKQNVLFAPPIGFIRLHEVNE
jgi:hypothetical protein